MPIEYDSYTRMSYWLEPDQFILIVDHEGNESFFKVARDEPMGNMFVKFADASHTLAPNAETGYIDLEFLAPKRQMRLYQIRPFLVQEQQNTGRLLPVPFQYLWSNIVVQWEIPSGEKRGGTDVKQTVTAPNTGISSDVGGVGNGIINPAVIPYGDNPNEVYDIWTIYNVFPAVNIINLSAVTLGADGIVFPWTDSAIYPDGENFNHYLGFIGRKYILVEPTELEMNKLVNRKMDYRGITIGGVPPLTTRV